MRFRLSTLLVVAPLLGVAMFGGLKWYEHHQRQIEIDSILEKVRAPKVLVTVPVRLIAIPDPSTGHAAVTDFPESDFGAGSGRAADIAATDLKRHDVQRF